MTISTSETNERFTPSLRRSILTAVFPDRAEARHMINDLSAFGLRSDQMSVAMRDRRQQNKLIADTGLPASDGAASSEPVGRRPGGLRGFIDGIRSNVLPVNPSLSTASHVAQGTVAPGGMIGTFMSMRMPEAAARRQESGYREGSVLVMAKVYEGVGEAQSIMQRHGGAMVTWEERATVV